MVVRRQPRSSAIPVIAGPRDSTSDYVDAERRLLIGLGFRPQAIGVAARIALRRGTTIAEELISLGYLTSEEWWATVARDLGVRHFKDLYLVPRRADTPLPDARMFRRVRQVMHRKSESAVLVVAPLGREIDTLSRDIASDPTVRRRVGIAAPAVIRRAFLRSFEAALTFQAINRLRMDQPNMSASNGLSLALRIVTCCALGSVTAFIAPDVTLATLDFLFLIGGGVRIAAALDAGRRVRNGPLSAPVIADADLPTYSVLIPLFQEARMVADLVRAMERIDYPRDRLSVHLVVEADDRETFAAALRLTARSWIEVIAVPPSKPRTKPKALDWALTFATGDLITVFDAEDRPAPDQLRLAAAAFAVGPRDLVCVQAILDIDHSAASSNWLTRQFTIEYGCLFRSLLPWLARHRLFLPIGGTSNHFRRDVLVSMGGWDPFNVTEDADLSIRIFRMGGRIGVIQSVTLEEAPLTLSAWLNQRRRWLKGWLQTWLVHMRNPARLIREMGLLNFALFQVLILGQFLSTTIYPFGVAMLVLIFIGAVHLLADRTFSQDLMLTLQLLALGVGWFGAGLTLTRIARFNGRRVRGFDLATVPIYWCLLLPAAILAITDLIVDPHKWNKTGHGIAERVQSAEPYRFPIRDAKARNDRAVPAAFALWSRTKPEPKQG